MLKEKKMMPKQFCIPSVLQGREMQEPIVKISNGPPLSFYLAVNYLDRFLSLYELPVRI